MIRLISTDFDGTLVEPAAVPQVQPEFFELIAQLRSRGVLWAINTGRSLPQTLDGLARLQFPDPPDIILANEREIFMRDASGAWCDLGGWNQRSNQAYVRLFSEEATTLAQVLTFIERDPGCMAIMEEGRFVGISAADNDAMDRFVERFVCLRGPDSALSYHRNFLLLRFCHVDYSKGAVLAEICRWLGLLPEEVFAVGDHLNDLAMLDGKIARWVAAPANAVADVRATVERVGGYVAGAPASGGVIEALRHFEKLWSST